MKIITETERQDVILFDDIDFNHIIVAKSGDFKYILTRKSEVGESYYQAINLCQPYQVSIYLSDVSIQSAITVMTGRGWTVEAFDNIQEAMTWLLKD